METIDLFLFYIEYNIGFCHFSKWCVSQKLHDTNIKIYLGYTSNKFRISYTEKNH